jgi:hypothetical protein
MSYFQHYKSGFLEGLRTNTKNVNMYVNLKWDIPVVLNQKLRVQEWQRYSQNTAVFDCISAIFVMCVNDKQA